MRCGAVRSRAKVPGERPFILAKKLIIDMRPTGQAPASGRIDGTPGTPAWLRARIARYEAKAFSADTAGSLTNNDVVTTANAEGMQKTCVQGGQQHPV